MIKLLTILKEMAISNAWSGEKGKLGEETDAVINAAIAMGENTPILWRGTGGVPVPGQRKSIPQRIMRVTPRGTSAFKGGTENAIKVLQLLNVEHPVFAHFNRDSTKLFGTPCALVLEQPYTIRQSPVINDIMADTEGKTEQELQQAAESYKDINDNGPVHDKNELIIDVENYWAIPCGDEIKTYGDLVNLLKSYKAKFA
jgi:hypothetical protein